MYLGSLNIDFTFLWQFFIRPVPDVVVDIIVIFGWAILSSLLIYAGEDLYIYKYKRKKFTANWKWVLLAIDIPALNVQTPKAVEQMFNHLAGSLNVTNIAEKYRLGFRQRWFSFEIISIEGYIQFLVRTEQKFRDLVEASIYAQYPDAEIIEVEDYVGSMPSNFPNNEYDIWAADFSLTEDSAFPIRTYEEFEHTISKDTVLKDPMGTFLESFSRLGPGEQMWFQILVQPTSNKWKEKSIEKIKKIIGDVSLKSEGGGRKLVDAISNAPLKFLEGLGDQIFGGEATPTKAKEAKREEPNLIRYLTPGQKKIVEAMEDKFSKVGFKTKMRGIYIARKEVFKPERGANALVGAISQFNIPSANCLAPTFKAYASYFFAERRINYRKSLLMRAYKKRKMRPGGKIFILNIEELATIWHFPMSHVKTPLVQKASGKKAEPPAGLPVELMSLSTVPLKTEKEIKKEEDFRQAQNKKTFVTDSGHVIEEDQKFG